ncbi:hypothetical protein ANN_02053 [Periplaneta americana]|uniref:Uncharacterized protein n=1 Tax=Periplaneta americana TaxID=6978 RepID=A0ABQ8TV54_PERAM|nr:hypothetical protein ANN_02053 [Periplaneta americana]
MECVKWTDRIRNEAVLERVDEERMMLKLIRKKKRNWLVGGKNRKNAVNSVALANAWKHSFFQTEGGYVVNVNITPFSRGDRLVVVGLFECTSRVFENKILRKIFRAKRDEVTGEWRKLHNTELHALNSSPDIIRNIKSRRLRRAGYVARMGDSRNAYRVLVGRPEGKRPLGRPRRRWEDNIKMDLREVGYDDRDWINLLRIGTNGGLM